MGGNLYKLGRLPKADYLKVEQKIRLYLDEKVAGNYRIPRYYGNKEDFGDVDIILLSDALPKEWETLRMEIVEDLGVTQYQSTGSVFSTVFDNFQVDYFLRSKQNFESTYAYLSFNDIGNLIGKIYKRFNLKYGEHGLSYVFRRADGHYKKDIPITNDFKKIFEFLDLEYAQWERGFRTREDMFKWVIASPYFSVKPYRKKDKSLQKREKERATMRYFMQFLEENNIQKAYNYLENRDEYLPQIAAYFQPTNLIQRIQEERTREEYVSVIKTKYNGRIVMQLFPSLQGKKLGRFMNGFEQDLGNHEEVLYQKSAEEIIGLLKDYYRRFN